MVIKTNGVEEKSSRLCLQSGHTFLNYLNSKGVQKDNMQLQLKRKIRKKLFFPFFLCSLHFFYRFNFLPFGTATELKRITQNTHCIVYSGYIHTTINIANMGQSEDDEEDWKPETPCSPTCAGNAHVSNTCYVSWRGSSGETSQDVANVNLN